MAYATYEAGEMPGKGEVYRDMRNGTLYSFVAIFHHDPKTCAPRDYVIVQEYGNYRNEVEIIELDAFPHLFLFEWGPLIECRFCGLRRMSVCTTRQNCPNFRDYRLEDDIALSREEPEHV